MDWKQITLAYLVKTLGINTQKAEEILSDDNSEALKQMEALHAAKVSEDATKAFDEGHGKAVRESLSNLEDSIKSEFKINSKKKGLELIKELVSTKSSPENIDEESVKKHPIFLQKEQDLEGLKAEYEDKLSAKDREFEAKEEFKNTAKDLRAMFKQLNPVLSKNEENAEKQINRVIEGVKDLGYTFKKQANNSYLVLKPDGTRKDDDHGVAEKVETLLARVADAQGFDFQTAQERTSAGEENTPVSVETKFKGHFPKNEMEYMTIITDTSIPLEQRNEVSESWNKKDS